MAHGDDKRRVRLDAPSGRANVSAVRFLIPKTSQPFAHGAVVRFTCRGECSRVVIHIVSIRNIFID